MSYDVIIIVLLMLLFCVFMQIFTVNIMLSLMKVSKGDEPKPIYLSELIGNRAKAPKKSKAQADAERKYDIIMENLEAYDGTGIGQKEVK